MRDNNNDGLKTKFIMAAVAVGLILLICLFSFLLHLRQKDQEEDQAAKLQQEVLSYAGNDDAGPTDQLTVPPDKTGEDAAGIQAPDEIEQGNKTLDWQEDKADDQLHPGANVEHTMQEGSETESDGTAAPNSAKDETLITKRQDAALSVTANNYDDIDLNPRNIQTQLKEMAGYWEEGNMAAVEDLGRLRRFMAMSHELKDSREYYYYGEENGGVPNGKGLAIYADNQYYYGSWNGGVRSGSGMWIKFFDKEKAINNPNSIYLLHSYTGEWKNDLPNGEGAEHYDFIMEHLKPNTGYNQNYIGNYRDGRYHGEIYITNTYSDGNVKEWSGTAVDGVWQAMGEKDQKGREPVIVEKTNPDNYIWLSPKDNQNQGVRELIS